MSSLLDLAFLFFGCWELQLNNLILSICSLLYKFHLSSQVSTYGMFGAYCLYLTLKAQQPSAVNTNVFLDSNLTPHSPLIFDN